VFDGQRGGSVGFIPVGGAQVEFGAAFLDAVSFDQIPVDGTASFDSARAMLRELMCGAGPEQMAADASLAAAEEPPWSPWRALALIVSAEAQLLLGNHDRAVALLRGTDAVAAALGDVGSLVVSRSELAILAMVQRQWAEAAEHVQVALATIDESRLHDYAFTVLAFCRGPARGAPRRPTRTGPSVRAGDARPDHPAHSPSPISPYRCGCNWPRCTPSFPTTRPHGTYCGRSTTSCSTGRLWARWSTR